MQLVPRSGRRHCTPALSMQRGGLSRSVLPLVAALALLWPARVLPAVLEPSSVSLRALLKDVVTEAVRAHCPGKADSPDLQVRQSPLPGEQPGVVCSAHCEVFSYHSGGSGWAENG